MRTTRGARTRRGFTLVELLVVVGLLAGLAALIALRAGTTDQPARLDAATEEVVTALRFARSEARRTGEPHGVRIEAATERLRVYRLVSGTPPTEQFDVRHPIDKQLWDVSIGEGATARVDVVSASFAFGPSGTPLESIAFAPSGEPTSPLDGSFLAAGQVDLAAGDATRTVQVAPTTGRVEAP